MGERERVCVREKRIESVCMCVCKRVCVCVKERVRDYELAILLS